MILSRRFEQALLYALQAHREQYRKASQVPYFSHLISCAALVMENGGDEDQTIAALLHDVAEDQGGLRRLEEIESLFGKRVRRIVEGCSDTLEFPKPPWHDRKKNYLEHLRDADEDVLLVSLADKVHNLRTIYMDYLSMGEVVWDRFQGGKTGSLWYFRSLLDVFAARYPSPMIHEFERLLRYLEEQ
ncbi:MAG: GTP pyrophosphokinase [Anaerolineae bacterium]|jgi:(p)ppGpp synthase/HD superfamily hydrolase|nr:MAG: GTP pyrophosphokinase [Anaerolineae bacterium]